MLAIQTWGRRIVGADKTTELWRPPPPNMFPYPRSRCHLHKNVSPNFLTTSFFKKWANPGLFVESFACGSCWLIPIPVQIFAVFVKKVMLLRTYYDMPRFQFCCYQCDQIGRFLKDFCDKISFPSASNMRQLFRLFRRKKTFQVKTAGAILGQHLGYILLQHLVTLAVT